MLYWGEKRKFTLQDNIHSKKKGASEHLFLVLQIVTNMSIQYVDGPNRPGRTMIGILGSFQIPFDPSRYSIESPICDNLKHQKKVL